jgi:ABC-type bacteriocin/lantibiotic exporter with double-glycine peptidase domain
MDNFFVNIIILLMLSYFQLLYDYFLFDWNYFTLHYLSLFMVIFNYFWLLTVISPYVIIGNSRLL